MIARNSHAPATAAPLNTAGQTEISSRRFSGNSRPAEAYSNHDQPHAPPAASRMTRENTQLDNRHDERTRMSSSSEKTKQQLHKVVSSIEAPLVIVDAAGTIEIANQKLCEMLGSTAGSIEGGKFTDRFQPVLSKDQFSVMFRNAMQPAAAPWSTDFIAQNAAGRNIQFNAKLSVIRPSSDTVSILVLLSCNENQEAAKRPPAQSSMSEVRTMIADAAGKFTAGHLEMIGLEEVRNSLGDRWERLASSVHGIANSILKSRLSKEDIFYRDAEGNYIICFASLSNETAWFKAKALGQEIREALLGEDATDQLAEFKLNADTRERLSSVRSATYEIEIPADEYGTIPNVVGLIKDKIEEASVQRRKGAASLLRSLAENHDVHFNGVKSMDGKSVPLQLATFDANGAADAERLRQIYGDAPKLVEQLDTLLLGAVLERMYRMNTMKMPVTVVGVNFQTLANPQSARSYYDILGSAVGKPAQSLIISVRDIPVDLHHGRIAEVLRLLRNYCRYTALGLTKPTLGNVDLAESRLSLAAFDFMDLRSMLRRDSNAVKELFKQLRQSNVRVAVDHLPEVRSLQALREAIPDFYTVDPFVDENWRSDLLQVSQPPTCREASL